MLAREWAGLVGNQWVGFVSNHTCVLWCICTTVEMASAAAYDVIVVGAGVEGSATAYQLVSHGAKRVLLLEQVWICAVTVRGCIIVVGTLGGTVCLLSTKWKLGNQCQKLLSQSC